MIKPVLLTTLSLLCAASLRAQSEPNASPAATAAHDAANPANAQKPPPIVATRPGAQPVEGETALVKNPPPIDPKNIDTAVKPQDDFYKFANGNWLKNNPVPPEYSRWGSFNELIEKNNDALHQIAEQASQLSEKSG